MATATKQECHYTNSDMWVPNCVSFLCL